MAAKKKGAGKKRATKRGGGREAGPTQSPTKRDGSKSAFVRGLPREMSARDVVAKAKEQGIELSEAYVYVIRSEAKRARKAGSKGGAASRASARGSLHITSGDPRERAVIEAIRSLGPARVRGLLAAVERLEGA